MLNRDDLPITATARGAASLRSVLRLLPKGGLERQAIDAGEIDAVIDYGSAHVIMFPAARRAMRKDPGRASLADTEAPGVLPARNRLLAALEHDARRRLVPALEQVRVESGDVLHRVGALIQHVYFPIDCVVALLTSVDSHREVQTGVIGHDGMVGMPLALGVRVSPVRTVVQVSGLAFRMPAMQFIGEIARAPELQGPLHRHAQAMWDQAARTAACIASHCVAQRLACWLLLIGDRANSLEMQLTQEQLATAFNVRRVSITSASGELRSRGLIGYRRGNILIRDRAGLLAASCRCYRPIDVDPHVEVAQGRGR